MSNDENLNSSFDYSNKELSEFPQELYQYKSTLTNLDISGNPSLNFEKTIKILKDFPNLKKLKINIETGEDAKKLLDELTNLQILNDHPIYEEEREPKKETKEEPNIKIGRNNNDIVKKEEIEQFNYNSIKSDDTTINQKNNFDEILQKIKEYKELDQQKFNQILNEYNKLNNNDSKSTLDICSYFNKVLINLIKEAQEKNNIQINVLKPLLEAQSLNESLRTNLEEKLHLALRSSKFSQDNTNEKMSKNETVSGNFEKNIIENVTYINYTNYKKNNIKRSETGKKESNNNDLRKNYSKNLSQTKIKQKSDIEDKFKDKKDIIKNINKEYLTEKVYYTKNNSKNKNNIQINKINQKDKKNKINQKNNQIQKKLSNKISFQQDNETYSNIYGNINTNTEHGNKILNISQPNSIPIISPNLSIRPVIQNIESPISTKNKGDKNTYSKKNVNPKKINKSNTNGYLSKYDMLKTCKDNPTINNILSQIGNINNSNEGMTKIFDGLKEQINYDYNNIHIINLKNLLDMINQVYKLRANRIRKEGCIKGTLETDLLTFLKSKYGLKKLIIEWNINILSSIKAFSKINGEVCLFGLILRNELDEGSIDIMFKIKDTLYSILNPLYKYDNEMINNIKCNKDFMKENEWIILTQILYNNDNNLRERFQKKIYEFIKNFIKNDEIIKKNGKKILLNDFMNQLILFNLKLRKKYLNNLVYFFRKQDKNKYGIINHNEFKSMIKDMKIIPNEKLKEVTDNLIENADSEGSGQITFNDVVISFDNYYLDDDNSPEEKIKLLDKINDLNLR